MARRNARLSTAFLERQRVRLEALRQELLQREKSKEAEERALRELHGDEPRDRGEEGVVAVLSEIGDALHHVIDRRLADVVRALAKIEEGTYGLSDASGAPIPKARLERVPEAIYTVEEEALREASLR